MKRILLVVLCVLSIPAAASHIVGGEFEIEHQFESTYQVNLILYFDQLNGQAGALDSIVTARIYRKRDNLMMMDIFLPLQSNVPVNYTKPECSNGEIQTSKLVYSTSVKFPSASFGDPQGYYIVWERCCRNYSIANVYSADPQLGGAYAGQTFYLEFPPVVKDGQPFFNSTPHLFPPLNDYACPNRPYYVDFAGTDADGDSLVYSLATPLNTKSSDALPLSGPRPAPYPDVFWRPPFNFTNILAGKPDLKISTDGLLTATPTVSGLFVFAVKCEEYRNKIKIGEVRRDFQMLVLTSCPVAQAPQIKGKKLTDAGFSYSKKMQVSFSNTTPDDKRCITIQVSDPDSSDPDHNFGETLTIQAIPIGFKKNVASILPAISEVHLVNGSTQEFAVCFDKCPYINGPFEVGIITRDNSCSLPLSDTLVVTVNIEPPPNLPPYFTTPNVTATLVEGNSRTFPIAVRDPDGNPLTIGLIPVGFSLQDAGMAFSIIQQEDGQVDAQLVWDAKCDVYDFTKKTNFQVLVVAEDADICNLSNPVLMRLNLTIKLPGNFPPVIDSNLTPDRAERVVTLTRKVFDKLEFDVTGIDLDNDFILLNGNGVGFDFANYNMQFAPVDGNGLITSTFIWNMDCEKIDLNKQSVFDLQFIVVDNVNKCRFNNRDTLDVIVTVEPPDNLPPFLDIISLNARTPLFNGSMATVLGDQIDLALTGTDYDNVPRKDHIKIDLIDARGTVPPIGYVFASAEGDGLAETVFSWLPECSIFENNIFENDYRFTFRVYDDRCFNLQADTVAIDITIKDVESNLDDFLPPNIITPNGDNCNDYLMFEGFDTPASAICETIDGDAIVRLPKDNCIRRFEFIRVYNRWGNKVYESNQRNFRWGAPNEPSGVYYYMVKFNDKEYKGSVNVRF